MRKVTNTKLTKGEGGGGVRKEGGRKVESGYWGMVHFLILIPHT